MFMLYLTSKHGESVHFYLMKTGALARAKVVEIYVIVQVQSLIISSFRLFGF